MGLVSVFLFLLGLFSFFNKQKHYTLIAIILLSSGYFNLVDPNFLLGSISLQHGDLALLLIFLLLPFKRKISDNTLKAVNKALLLFFAFLTVSILYDFFLRGTSIMQIFRTTRKTGYLMFFYLIGSFSWKDYQKLIKFLIIATLFHSILYISQYIFGYSFTPSLDQIKNEIGGTRYTNGPFFIIPTLVICTYFYSTQRKYGLYISIFLIAVILGQSRGAIISAISILLLYLFFQKKMRPGVLVVASTISCFAYIVVLSYFPVIGERFSNLYSELNLVSEMDHGNLQAFFHEGSFIFRYGLTYERLMYVLQDSVKSILGVGFVPDMDIIKPIFTLGTHSASLPTGFEQYNSVDIFFPNILTRYGLLGSLIFLYFIIQLFSFSYEKREMFFGKVLLTYLFSMIFISLINETFYNGQYFIIIFVLMGLVILESRMENNTELSNLEGKLL